MHAIKTFGKKNLFWHFFAFLTFSVINFGFPYFDLMHTCYSAISLKHFFYISLGDLECVQVADKDPGIDSLWIHRTGLIANFAQIHHGHGCQLSIGSSPDFSDFPNPQIAITNWN